MIEKGWAVTALVPGVPYPERRQVAVEEHRRYGQIKAWLKAVRQRTEHGAPTSRRLLVAVLVGGNLQVPTGKTVGATFTKVPRCTSGTETGGAIAFSSYPSQPPADSLFGWPGQGVSLQSGQTAKAGQQVARVNPANLAGGTTDPVPYFLTLTQVAPGPYIDFALKKPVPTPWVTYPELYSASCNRAAGPPGSRS